MTDRVRRAQLRELGIEPGQQSFVLTLVVAREAAAALLAAAPPLWSKRLAEIRWTIVDDLVAAADIAEVAGEADILIHQLDSYVKTAQASELQDGDLPVVPATVTLCGTLAEVLAQRGRDPSWDYHLADIASVLTRFSGDSRASLEWIGSAHLSLTDHSPLE